MKLKPLDLIKYIVPVLFIIALGIFLIKWSDVDKFDLVSNKSQEFEKAVVTEVITDNLQEDGSRVGSQVFEWKEKGSGC